MIFHGIYVIVIVLLLFGVSIFVHELGHFIAARMFGMVVDVFSLGFGPAIWKKKHRGILYKIGIFPLGGYVALPQMDPTDILPSAERNAHPGTDQAAVEPQASAAPPGKSRREPLPAIAPWKKIIVAAAGAAGNMLLATIIAWIVYIGGKPSTPGERCAVIGFVDTNSAAYAQGLRIGDEILAVNDIPVGTWNEVIQENARFETVRLSVRTPTGTNPVAVPTEKNALGFRMVAGLREVTLCRIGAIEEGSSAERAGIQPQDLIVSFNGEPVLSVEHLIGLVSARPDMATPIEVERNGQTITLTVTPQPDPALARARIGIRFDPMAVDYDQVVHIPPGAQLKGHATMILRVVRALLSKEARQTAEGLGGPPMILYMIHDAVRKGIMIALWFMCFLNVNLAILNLMPIPILDGGHIMFSLWELVTRRPIHPKVIAWIYQFFFFLFLAAIILLSSRDFQRLYKLFRLSQPSAIPTNAAAQSVTNGTTLMESNQLEIREE